MNILASGLMNPRDVALSQGRVFIAVDDGTIRSVPNTGGILTTLASGDQAPARLAVDATSVYWLDQSASVPGAIRKVAIAGGTPVTLAAFQLQPNAIAVDATGVYWTGFDSAPGTPSGRSEGATYKVPLDGWNVTVFDAPAFVRAMAEDALNVYFVSDDGTVRQQPKAGGPSVVLSSGQPTPWSILVIDPYVYWTNKGNGTIMRMPKTGGTPEVVVSGQNQPQTFSYDGTYLVWTDISNNLWRCNPDGSGVRELIVNYSVARSLVASGGYVYTAQGSQIERVTIDGTGFVVLANPQFPQTLLEASGFLYFDAQDINHPIQRMPIAGGTTTTLSTTPGWPQGIDIDAQNAYYTVNTNAGRVEAVPLAGGSPRTLFVGSTNPGPIMVDSTYAFISGLGQVGGVGVPPVGKSFISVPIGGWNVTRVVLGSRTPSAVAVDASGWYWGAYDGAVMVAALDGSNPTMLATGGGIISSMAVYGSDVYWIDSSSTASVFKVSKSGGVPTTLASGSADNLTSPYALAVDAGGIYVANRGTLNSSNQWVNGSIVRVPLGGGSAQTVAANQGGPTRVAIDASCVYWSNISAGTVARTGR